jgi:hypothetical protein
VRGSGVLIDFSLSSCNTSLVNENSGKEPDVVASSLASPDLRQKGELCIKPVSTSGSGGRRF